MRIVHTADWHLGHVLHDWDREAEHAAFLDWLLDTLSREAVDALLVCGDVFDGANPPAAALALWYRFLAQASRRCPGLQVVVVAGNHDSPARLVAPAPVLEALDVRVVGLLPRVEGTGEVDTSRLVLPLRRRSSPAARVDAWVVALPFLRLADVPCREGSAAAVVEGVRQIHGAALDAARSRRQPGQALVVTGHCYVEGTSLSDESERKVLGGNQHPLPADLFPSDVDYVALGHLHRAQKVAGRRNVRYSGSPIPLSLDEDGYPHQVCLVDLAAEGGAEVSTPRVPRTVPILRIPDEPAPLDEVLALLHELPEAPAREPGRPDLRPYLEVRVRLDGASYGHQAEVARALEGKDGRLAKITADRGGSGQALADGPEASLETLTPETVFLRLWEKGRTGPVPPPLLAAFHELVELAAREEEP